MQQRSINSPKDNVKSRKNALDRDWTKGSITGNLWSLAWPMTISSSVMMLGPLIDMIWIGRLGPTAMAGVVASGTVVMLINSLIMGLFTGLRALVARFVGAGDNEKANLAAQQGLVVGVVLSLVIAAIGQFLAEDILRLWKLEPDVVTAGATYMRVELIGIFTMSFGMMAQSTMQASGDARTPMNISIGTRLLQIFLAPFLIFGLWIFPELGIRGAALAAVIAQGAGGAVGLWILFTGRTRLRVTLKHFAFDRSIIWRTVKVGIPASLSGIHMNVGNIVFMWFIAPFGTDAVAGHGIVSRIDMFVLMPALGLGSAAGILAAQNLGANQPDRSVKTAWTAVGWFTGIMFIFSIVILVWAPYVVRIFNSDPALVDIAGKFLKIQTVSYMFNGLMVVLMSCLNAVGDTLISMLVDIATMWGIRVPLAYFLPKITTLGVYGVRWALVADTVSSSFVFIAYFLAGRWKHKKV
jgi:putative MATE family efflux protein